jgi:hypothetical protein
MTMQISECPSMTSKARAAFTNRLFAVHHLGHGRHGWVRYGKDKQHYALITDDSGTSLGEEINNPATAVWLVGVYSHDGWGYSHCERVAGLDAAIARALEMLKSPHRHLRKWVR